MMDRLRLAFPWGIESGVRSILLTLASGFGLIITWYGVSGRGVFQDQIPWLSAGIVILMVSLFGQGTLIVRGRRALGERRSQLLADSLASVEIAPRAMTGGSLDTRSFAISDIERVVVVDGLNLFHRAGCPMLSGRATTTLTRHAARAAGLDPCGICSEGRTS